MKIRQIISSITYGCLIGLSMTKPSQSADLSIADVPLFLVSIKPSIMVMLDNSGSMKSAMYTTGFDATVDYYGIFEATANYEYDPTIAVNSAAYNPVSIDTSKTGAFVASNCTPSNADLTCWSGRYLNWLTTRRIDASRMVMVGGKLESTAGYAYGGSYQYKIVGNNEYADRDITKTYSSSSNVSPVPDDTSVMVYSPADANGGAIQNTYDPYGKITVGGSGGIIYDSGGSIVGEFGKQDILASIDVNGDLTSWSTVSLRNTYTNPVVIATPPTFNGGDPSVVRLKDVAATSFQITIQEWEYNDGNHTGEEVSYVVMEAGSHTLPDGIDVKAGSISTSAVYDNGGTCNLLTSSSHTESFTLTSPVVIASVMTFNGPEAVTSRVWDVSDSGFTVALQEEQDPVSSAHSTEIVGYIAFEEGTLTDAANVWSLEAGTVSGVTHDQANATFTSAFNGVPTFVAAMQTKNDDDTAVLRLDELSSSVATLHIEEEQSCEIDVTHSSEDVGYIALRGSADLNIALAVDTKPQGLLQDLSDGVRLGVSFYRYNPDANDIYNQNVQGGTIRFKIPINPFVKKPSDTSLPAGEIGYTELDGYIGTAIDDIVNAVNKYPLVWGTTPIAENLWEVVQYFEQDTPYYTDVVTGFADFDIANDSNPERDPFYFPDYSSKLYCSSPSVVIFTDGFPYKDADIPVAIQDYDEDSHTDDVADTDINAQGKDNLDDVAYWAFCDKSTGACPYNGTPEDGTRDLRDDLSGDQYLTIYTVGFADGDIRQVLEDTAYNAGGERYAAEGGLELKTALKQVFSAAMSRSSASSVAVNTGSITGSSKLYQAVFDGTDWSGDIEAFAVNLDGSIAATPSWKASDNLPIHTDRHIITYDGTIGQPFQWANITVDQQTLLGSEEVLNYLRGDSSLEESSGGSFRDRTKLLGDFINSAPVWLGGPAMHYPDNWGDTAAENVSPYSTFKSNNSNRIGMVYAGSNDGMMHAFNADTGAELFAYVPGVVYSDLANLTLPDYAHQYYVDGSVTVVDAFFTSWHTVLTAGLNAGGQGVYALDVTYPGDFSTEAGGAANVLWEFDDGDDSDLGYTYSQPNVVRLQDDSWAVIFGNGYNNTEVDNHVSADGNAVLYIVDVSDGSLIKKLDTGEGTADDPTGNGRPNGFATVSPVDVTGDSIVDYVYAGDLFGNMWKFDLNNSNKTQWDVAYGKPLFTACAGLTCDASNSQPITTRPQVGRHPSAPGYIVYFGTGKYFEFNDDSSASQVTQSFYGIWDKDEGTLSTTLGRSSLLQQSILAEIDVNSDSVDDYRITSNESIDWTSHMGWYMDLVNTEGGNTDNKGERQISASILREDRIIFTTMIPEDNPCSAGGTGWLMELDANDGSLLEFTPFDVNNDGKFDEDDYIQATIDVDGDGDVDDDDKLPPSGVKSQVGIIPMPAILADPKNDKEYKYTPGTKGDIQVTTENPGPGARGRQSWSELNCQ
ncbi:MAG: PilC/PilY family type IV pilus protein [Pseudomonadota bacterium]